MRLTCGLAIALWPGLLAAGMVCQQPDPAGSVNSTAQTPAPTEAPTEKAPVETSPAPEKKAPDSAAKAKPDAVSANAGSTSGTRKRRKRSAPSRSAPPPVPDGGPRRIVVREGGAKEPAAQIAPGLTPVEATRQRQNADQLLVYTDGQLKLLTERTLNAREQETVLQIRNYADGARSALKEGDVRRANTLAEKARLLAEDLVKH
jgi:hypothetical protein